MAGPTTDTRFLYDGDALVAEHDGAGALVRRYVHGAGPDEPLAAYGGASVAPADERFLMADHHGSILLVFDRALAQRRLNSYDEWGVPGGDPGVAEGGRFRYTGQAWLPELGLYHYKARMYSPALGRFLQTDPVGYDDQLNLYAYVGNDPVNGRDPDGREAASFSVYGRAPPMGNTHSGPFLQGMVSYPNDLFAEARQAVRLTGVLGREEQNRALLIDDLAVRGWDWIQQNPQQTADTALTYFRDNPAFFVGRSAASLTASLLGRSKATAGFLFAGSSIGGVVRALNGVVRSLEAGKVAPGALSSRTLGAIVTAGAIGASVSFNARTGDITASIRPPDSRIVQQVTICNVREDC